MIAYKFLNPGLKSNYDGSPWEIGKWRTVEPTQKECVGLNCSKLIVDALGYVQGKILAKVEYRGKIIDSGDKLTCEKMRVVKAWKWTKKESVKIAIFAARLVLPNFETTQTNDDRPRKAIEAAEKWPEKRIKKNLASAASAASAADAAAKNKIHKYILTMLKDMEEYR